LVDYINAANLKPSTDRAQVWLEYAIEPYWAEWAQGQFNEARTREQLSMPILNLEELAVEVDSLKNSEIEQLVEKAYMQITQVLPSPLANRAVCIYAADPGNQWLREQGVLGTGIGDNILLQINPLAPNWSQWVPYILAHEYHHAVWGYNYFAVQQKSHMDLLTGLLIDGEADTFAKLLYPDRQPTWINALTPDEEAEQWGKMQEYLKGNDGTIYERFFFGDRVSGTPSFTAYTIGYRMVQAYLKCHPTQTVFDLMNKESEEILSESGYEP
jgi:uncharacterized protein YjaZ